MNWGYLYCSAMNAAAYTLEPVDDLGPGDIAGVRRIFEDGFAPHLRSEFGTLTTGREPGEIPLALVGLVEHHLQTTATDVSFHHQTSSEGLLVQLTRRTSPRGQLSGQ